MNAIGAIGEPFDVLIVGAGISGIGMAAHLAAKCPNKRFAILERRERLGGTWDLFRYPGVRSDSDMYTLGYEFEPWRDDKAIAQGDKILAYLNRIADVRGLRKQMHFGCHVLAADWDSGSALWTLTMADGSRMQGRFLFLGAGYYDHDSPHDAAIPGLTEFGGTVIHPQFWPDNFGHGGKCVVVIGSGATAVTLVPALAQSAAHVTMLQRTPSWYFSIPAEDGMARLLYRLLPPRWAFALIRARNIAFGAMLFHRSRTRPEAMKASLQQRLRDTLGAAYDERAFTPPYDPWQQRLCFVPDGDLFEALKAGTAEIVTGTIAKIDKKGIRLDDGRCIAADVIVTATGLRMIGMGKIAVSVDGAPVNFAERWFYRNCMFSNVPNFAALMGYLNAGWTLKVDLVADWLCRMFGQMDRWNRQVATPWLPPGHDLVEANPLDQFSSGYLQRARDLIPRSAANAPWRIGMDYYADRDEMRHCPIDDGIMRFERAPSDIPLAPALP